MAKRQKNSTQAGQVRITAGRWRGRKLRFPATDDLRPSGDRVRETLFNWLLTELPGARCLDLFAGSGALGFEAASRQTSTVVMIEQNREACRALRQHCEDLAADDVTVIQGDAIAWLEANRASFKPFDIVFLDPPFMSPLLSTALRALEEGDWLSPQVLIYIETPANAEPPYLTAERWVLYRQRTFGAVDARLYRGR